MAAELLALAVLSALTLSSIWRTRIASEWAGPAIACLIVALPLLQLLPIPSWLWHWPAPRLSLERDLMSAGVTDFSMHWGLATYAAERDLLSMLPAIALFTAMLALPRNAWRGQLWWLIGLVVFSLALAFVQMSAAQDSVLNPFPQYAPALAGIFANRNHEACALAMALVLALTLLLDAYARSSTRVEPMRGELVATTIVVTVIAATLPLVNSRAGVIVAIVGTAAALWIGGTWSREHWRESRSARWLAASAICVLAMGVYGAFAWVQEDASTQGSRWEMATSTVRIATANMPLGSGFGSFIPMFEQASQGALMHQGYINAAHNDYAQWWMEGGFVTIVAMLAITGILIASAIRLLRLPRESNVRTTGMAALLALIVPLLHSTVDYPLRTPALMSAFGMLAGIALAAARCARGRTATSASHRRNRPAPANTRRHSAPSNPPCSP